MSNSNSRFTTPLRTKPLTQQHRASVMSKRTFIPKWNSHHRPPVVFGGYRRSTRSSTRQFSKPQALEAADGRVRLYSDAIVKGPKQQGVTTHERLTQRVGMFRNAKHSKVVVNDLSTAVRQACNKQINRLVAADNFCGEVSSPVPNPSAKDVRQTSRVQLNCQPISNESTDDCEHPEEWLKYAYKSTTINDSGYEPILRRKRTALGDNRVPSCCKNENEQQSHTADRSRRSILKKSANVKTSDEDDSDDCSYLYQDTSIAPVQQRRQNAVAEIAAEHRERMRTPECRKEQMQLNFPKNSRSFLSLGDISARILSALPPIYLRDDHHDKYDAVALRLLADNIKRSKTGPGSNSSLIRSFLDRTGCIAVGEETSQLDDNAYENVFQDYPLGFNLLSSPGTPELEKLFNRTVGASKLEDDPEFSMHPDQQTFHFPTNTNQVSSLMTPASLHSNHQEATLYHSKKASPENYHGSVADFKFPFSRSPSSSASSSPGSEIRFDWTIPEANKY
ncbi:hypothetical protein RB195_003349 [Necator americanus]|uniref:Uncharacterized protein n=2 Tax=Necator americanus TaxID=51031 RepID=A0ABR1DN67_NECAM